MRDVRRTRRLLAPLVGAAVLVRHYTRAGTVGHKRLARAGDDLARHVRYWAGRWRGVAYGLRGRRPDPHVPDDVLADRIRSSLGPLEARLDVPRVHVMVCNHVALLHGDVATAAQAEQIEDAVEAVSGVAGVQSHLHVGLLPGDSRPSEGSRGTAPSPALRQLRDAAVRAGADEMRAVSVVGAILAVFTEELPAGERNQLLAHLPADVRRLAEPRQVGMKPMHLRRVGELVLSVVAATGGVPLGRAEHVIESVLGCLRELVPEEAHDVSAVLPSDLRELWDAAVPG